MRLSLQLCIYLCCSDDASPRPVLQLQMLRLYYCYCDVLMVIGAQSLLLCGIGDTEMTAIPYSWREGSREGCVNTAYMLIFPNLSSDLIAEPHRGQTASVGKNPKGNG